MEFISARHERRHRKFLAPPIIEESEALRHGRLGGVEPDLQFQSGDENSDTGIDNGAFTYLLQNAIH